MELCICLFINLGLGSKIISEDGKCQNVCMYCYFVHSKMSKVASITISAKSRTRSGSYETSPTATHAPKNGVYEDTNSSERSPAKTVGLTSSDSEEDKHFRRRGSSSSGSPERKR